MSLLAGLRLCSTLKMVLPQVIKNVERQVGRQLRGKCATTILCLPSAASRIPGSYVSHTSLHASVEGFCSGALSKSDVRITRQD